MTAVIASPKVEPSWFKSMKATGMMKAATTKRNFSKATRWLMAAVLLSLSSVQLTRASVAAVCDAASQPEACRCTHACDPTGPMHQRASRRPGARQAPNSLTIDANTGASEPSDFSCCRALPPGDRSVVTTSTSTQEIAVALETTPPVRAVALAALASNRAHDPPDIRPLYLTNSCLLI